MPLDMVSRSYNSQPAIGAFLPTNRIVAERKLSSSIPRGRALFWEGDQQNQKIEIVEGVVRAVRLLPDGSRQILAFYWPGDVVMPTRQSCQQFTAEAVTDCRVVRSPVVDVCQGGAPCGTHQVLEETLSLAMSMSQRTCVARVAWLLLRIQPHLREDPKYESALRLRLPRADIADHIGTSLETVCRTLAHFKAKKLIDLPNRKTIKYLDREGLARVASTRTQR